MLVGPAIIVQCMCPVGKLWVVSARKPRGAETTWVTWVKGGRALSDFPRASPITEPSLPSLEVELVG